MHEGPDDSGGTVLEQMVLGCIKSDLSMSQTAASPQRFWFRFLPMFLP